MTTSTPPPGPMTVTDAAWAKVRALGDIQYVPLNPAPTPPRQPPAWLHALSEWLAKWLSPLGKWLNTQWHVIEVGAVLLVGVALVIVGWLVWRDRRRRVRAADPATAPGWQPDLASAKALLDDADTLAQSGRFDDAVHVLLRRAFSTIATTRPDWLTPASTAREIAALAAMPPAARSAFAVLTGEVERSRYAHVALGQPDWLRARAAFATFALPDREAEQ